LCPDQPKPLVWVALTGMKQSYVDTTKYLIDHLPIDNKLFRHVSFLQPFRRDSELGMQTISRLAVMMPISEEKVELITHGLCTRPELLTQIVENKLSWPSLEANFK